MNTLQQKAVEIFERPWDEMARWTKAKKLEYEHLLGSSSRKERAKVIGFQDDIVNGAVRLYYTNNTNAQGGRSNGGGRGWYISGPVTPGCVRSELVLAD